MRQRVRDLIQEGDKLFAKRESLHSLWQHTAEHFYPERADFTSAFSMGEDFADHLMTGRPVLARRDLANSFSAMLRPRGRQWFKIRTADDRVNDDPTARRWLDWATAIQWKAMYDRRAQFVRATKQGDNDFAAFGQCVIEPTPNTDLNGVLFRSWHIRDVVWCDNAELEIDTVHRDWKIEAVRLKHLFPDTIDKKVIEAAKKDPYREIKCRHIILPADQYDYSGDAADETTHDEKSGKEASKPTNTRKQPFVSLYIDCENETVLEEKGIPAMTYVIPRWVTVSGSQYAYSPASIVALPEARLIQQITLTLLEAGQKIVDPPSVAVDGSISAANLYAGGTTWVDYEHDEKLSGPALRYLPIDGRGLQWGVDREQRVDELIKEAFFLNQIAVPALEGDMTATEYRGRYEEYIRRALPLFEPLEVEYNGGVCERTFDILLRMGAFGSPYEMPAALRGADVRFQFKSPLQQAAERSKSQAFIESANLLRVAAEIDPGARHALDVGKAFRDALNGAGAPADWITSEDYEDQKRAADLQAQQAQELAQAVGGGAQVAGQVGGAMQQLQQAGIVPAGGQQTGAGQPAGVA